MNTERVREDASGDSEDGEDDELPCAIGESAGDYGWRGSLINQQQYNITQYTTIQMPFKKFPACYRPLYSCLVEYYEPYL